MERGLAGVCHGKIVTINHVCHAGNIFVATMTWTETHQRIECPYLTTVVALASPRGYFKNLHRDESGGASLAKAV